MTRLLLLSLCAALGCGDDAGATGRHDAATGGDALGGRGSAGARR